MPDPCPPRSLPLNSISTKIIFFVFLSTFLTALVVSWVSIQSTFGHLRRQIDHDLPAQIERAAERWGNWTQAGVGELGELGALSLSSELLESRSEKSPHFDGFAIVDDRGELLAAGGRGRQLRPLARDLPGPPGAFAQKTSGGTIPMARVRLESAEPMEPIEPAGQGLSRSRDTRWLIGTYRLEGDPEQQGIGQILAAEAERVSGRIYLLDPHGGVVAASEPGRHEPAMPMAHRLGAAETPVFEFSRKSGGNLLGASVAAPLLGFQLIVEAPFELAFKPILSTLTRIFAIDLSIILLFSAVAYRVTSSMVQPIEALSDGARRIAQGQIGHEIPDTRRNDEIGLLTRTFNEMMRKLRSSQLEVQEAHARLQERNDQLQRANEVLEQLSITDGLTKLHNHRFFQDHMTREIKRQSRTSEPLSMLLIDLDDFKQLNDSYGHAAGDQILVQVSRILNASVRESDVLARYGGEEFVVLAIATDLEGTMALAEKIRTSVAEARLVLDDVSSTDSTCQVTVSIGAAQYTGNRKHFFLAADRALYRAKGQGKNCVVMADDDLG